MKISNDLEYRMAGNYNDTKEDKENFEDTGEFDLDFELKDLTSFLQEMGVELEDETEADQEPEALAGEEIADGISFRFGEEDAVRSGDILESFMSGPDEGNLHEAGGTEDRYGTADASDVYYEEDAEKEVDDTPDTEDAYGVNGEYDTPDTEDAHGVDDEFEAPVTENAKAAAASDAKELKKVEKEVDKALRKTFGRPFSWKREVISWVAMFVIAFALAYVIDNYLIVNATVPTGSMQNTIMAGDRMIGWRLSYLFSDPERGDIIIFEYPDNPEEIYVKRVIGLPGETVTISDGKIYINDSTEPLEEDYLPEEWVWKNDGFTFVVPENSYLCLGDNRNNSHDARSWTNTYVTKDAILGQAIVCYWPMEDFRWLY